MSVIIVGSIAIDHVKTPAEEHHCLLGGSASYASVAASFYTQVKMVGVVGTDFPPEHRSLLEARQIDLEGLEVAEGKTFRWSGEYEQNMNRRQTLSVELNVFEHFRPKLPSHWRATPFLLLGNIAPSLQMDVLNQIESPRFVLADTMDLWINLAKPDLLRLLPRVDMLILNDSEAHLLTGESNPIAAGREILKLGPKYVAIKKGEHGCLLLGDREKDEFFCTSAYPLERVADPTGAGDSFAGALAGALAKEGLVNWPHLKRAVIEGTLVASYTCEEFSLRRLVRLTEDQLRLRREEFLRYIEPN
jgi:sugar/nucleoside kinase (ribokinase family)